MSCVTPTSQHTNSPSTLCTFLISWDRNGTGDFEFYPEGTTCNVEATQLEVLK